jgi:hypothetical protein
MTITTAGLYQLSLAEYVADPAPRPSLNTSTALTLLTQSPLHAKLQHVRLTPDARREESSRADLGSIAHALLLEGDMSTVVVVEADDWRTKAAKEQRDAARADGKLPILTKDYGVVMEMVQVADHALMGSELCTDWLSAKAEQTLIWQEDGTWCRARPDKLTPDDKVYFEYKTTASAHPAAFVKTAINQGYDLQAVLGRRGVKAVTGIEPTVVFVVQEIEPPYAVSFISLSPMFLSIAEERLLLALEQWRRCMTSNEWPGYSERVATVDPPGWYGMDQMEAV